MKNYFISVAKDGYHVILNSGIYKDLSPGMRKTVFLMNRILLLALTVNFVGLIYYFISDLFLSALVNLMAGSIFCAGIYCNYLRRIHLARALSIFALNFYFIAINIVEGLQAGEYFFYFPAFIILIFMSRVYRNNLSLIVTYILTAVVAVLCVWLIPQTGIQLVTNNVAEQIYYSRFILSVLLTIAVAFLMLRINRKSEHILMDEKNFSDSIFNTSLDAVFIIDACTGLLHDCNRCSVDLFGIQKKSQLVGTHFDNWLEGDKIPVINALSLNEDAADAKWQGEMTVTTVHGKSIYCFASAVKFTYKQTDYIKISILDISELKKTQFHLIQAKDKAEEASRMKTRFLSNMSHELRTPLNGIIGASNLLLEENYLVSQKSNLGIIKNSSEHMIRLVNDILDHTKMEAGKMELIHANVNLFTLIDKIVSQFKKQLISTDVIFRMEIDPLLNIELFTDETRINQVVTNLLSNAIKFTQQGQVTLTVTRQFIRNNKARVRFSVVDTGIGIPPNRLQDIFESFTQAEINTTRKYGGTGLGLTIVKDILKLFNSELKVQSEVGKGSCFEFELLLPIHSRAKSHASERQMGKLATLNGAKILIAEDNPVNLVIVKRFLDKWGIAVEEATNGREAIDKFEIGAFDLLLLDLEMPVVDGAEALKEIRKRDSHVPIMAFTAAVYENIQSDLYEKGFDDYIHKPFRPEELHGKIQALMQRKSA